MSDTWEIGWEHLDAGKPSTTSILDAINANEVTRWARAMLEPGVAVILDTETVDLDTVDRHAPACEIAVIDACTGETRLNTLINPKTPISKKAFEIHHISNADVATMPTWPEVLPDVLRVTAGKKILAYSSDYDFRVVCGDSKRYQLDPSHLGNKDNWDCVMKRRAQWEHASWRRLDGDHRALGDCLKTRDILLEFTTPAQP